MTKVALAIPLLLAFLFHTGAEAQKKRPVHKAKALTSREIAEKVMPSVVLIITQDENGNPLSQGSGFVYKPGLVVSNLHVFERASNAFVKNVKTGEISKAIEVVGMNARQDICVIRIGNTKFPAIAVGNSQAVKTGDEIYVASNPKGLEGSFSKGIISGLRTRNGEIFPDDELAMFLVRAGKLEEASLIQIDAAISPGSSGGLLVNTRAEAIGMIKSTAVGGQNLNFAIPIGHLIALPLRFRHSIQLAGACAYTDLKKEQLIGRVRSLETKEVPRELNTGKVTSRELITTSKSLYDENGNNIEYQLFDATNGRLAITYKYFTKRMESKLK